MDFMMKHPLHSLFCCWKIRLVLHSLCQKNAEGACFWDFNVHLNYLVCVIVKRLTCCSCDVELPGARVTFNFNASLDNFLMDPIDFRSITPGSNSIMMASINLHLSDSVMHLATWQSKKMWSKWKIFFKQENERIVKVDEEWAKCWEIKINRHTQL